MATETVYTTGTSSANARINIGSGALSTADGQIAFPDGCSSIKLVGFGSAADSTGTLLAIDNSGIIKKITGTLQPSVLPAATNTTLGATYASVQTSGTGGLSMAVGYQIPTVFTIGSNTSNTLVGYQVAGASTTTTTFGNTIVGCQAMNNYDNGSQNTAIGAFAGVTCKTGTNNVFLGYAADMNGFAYSGSVALGANTFIKASNELAIAPNITQIRAEGLTTITPKGYYKMVFDNVNKIMKPMQGGDFWSAAVTTDYSQTFTSGAGSGAVTVSNLAVEYGSTASWLTSGTTVTIPSGFPNLGIWEVTVNTYISNVSTISSLSLDILRGATVFARYETGYSTTTYNTLGGTRLVQLTPGQTIVMRLNYTTTGAATVTIKGASTYIHMKFLGLGTL